uniref:THAP-type domain-containing protein n=1 Tax=Rhinopithecus bieti TaxID=61621 RepID=A0A2K6LQN8_RHIBE
MPNLGAVLNCTRRSTQSDLAFFRFRRDPARCQKWVENCRSADLEDKTPNQLNKHYRWCAKHFATSMICRTNNAIPTIFDLTSHLNNPHSRHRKQIKELSEDEIRTLKQKKIDETSEQEQKHKETNNSNAQNPSEEGGEGQDEDILPLTLEEKENKEYLKSLFEILILMGKQNILLDGHEVDEIPEGLFTPDNFQALLECRINSGEEVLRKQFETTAVKTLFCSKTQQRHCIREETLREVRDSHFFSMIIDDVVDIAGEEHLPVLVRFVDESHNLREEFVGFLPYEAEADILAVKFHTMITEKWGLNMKYCRNQANIVSSGFSSKMKIVASRLLEKYPQATYTICASLPVIGVSVALGTIEEVCFFHRSPQLLLELDSSSKERGKELKEICHYQWTGSHDAFEILVELLQALVLGLDGTNSDTNIRWNNCIAGRPFVLCSAVTDFDFIVTIVVPKNVLFFTRAFGKNLQGQTSDVFFAASGLTAVLHSLNEVMENIEVYHEFWFEEATNLATKLDTQMKLPGKFRRLTSESYYKETLSVPTVEHIIQELKDIFSEQHLKALKCLSLVPSLRCWRIKWSEPWILTIGLSGFFFLSFSMTLIYCLILIYNQNLENLQNKC